MTSFVERLMNVTFTLKDGTFAETKTNQVTLSGLRMKASISNAGGVVLGNLNLTVYGMTMAMMNKLVVFSKDVSTNIGNTVAVTAGDASSGMAQVFYGGITQAHIDYGSAPDVALVLAANSGMPAQVTPAAANGYSGSTDVASIIESQAKSIGYGFKNNGVTVKIASPYLYGSAIQQIKSIAQAAGIVYDIEGGTVTIWPNGGVRDTTTLTLSPSTGLVGYPTYTGQAVDVSMLFNPSIKRGRQVVVTSVVPQACGTWFINDLSHELSAQDPGGSWFTRATLIAGSAYTNG